MASTESFGKGTSAAAPLKSPLGVQSALSFVSVLGTRLKTSKNLEDTGNFHQEVKSSSGTEGKNICQNECTEQSKNEVEYLQVVSSPPRIKKIISCNNNNKSDCLRNLRDHFLCERFEMHMLNHLRRSKSEIVQKSFSARNIHCLDSRRRPASTGMTTKRELMRNSKFYKRLNFFELTKNSESGTTPPTSPDNNLELNETSSKTELENPSAKSDIPKTFLPNLFSSTLVNPERGLNATWNSFLKDNKTIPSEEEEEEEEIKKKSFHHSSDSDKISIESLKNKPNLPPEENLRHKKELSNKILLGKDSMGVTALTNTQKLKDEFSEEKFNKTIEEQKKANSAFVSRLKSKKFSKRHRNRKQMKQGETTQNKQSTKSIEEQSYGFESSSKTEREFQEISDFFSFNEDEENKATFDEEEKNKNPKPTSNEKENFGIEASSDVLSQIKHDFPRLSIEKLDSLKKTKSITNKKSSRSIPRANVPNIEELLKPVPSQGHQKYFDPFEIAERRRQKLLEKTNPKKIFFDSNSLTAPPIFQDYGWLAKYCIFNKDNWMKYGRAFEAVDTTKKGWLTPKETLIALRTANSQLTPSEEEYLCRIIEMTGYSVEEGSDLRLFSILAALSHRITSLENWMKILLDNLDYKQLEMKTFKCKTLWECNVDPETNKISLEQLCVELKVGGVSVSHEKEAKEHLQHLKALDLLDFLTYIPLFIMIHQSVIENPLDFSRKK